MYISYSVTTFNLPSSKNFKVANTSKLLSKPLIYPNQLNLNTPKDRTSELDILLFKHKNFGQYFQTQKGSRSLQKMLPFITNDKMDLLVGKLGSFFGELMQNKYGNYLCQKIFAISSSEQRKFILSMVRK